MKLPIPSPCPRCGDGPHKTVDEAIAHTRVCPHYNAPFSITPEPTMSERLDVIERKLDALLARSAP